MTLERQTFHCLGTTSSEVKVEQIDLIRIFTVGLKRTCKRCLCGRNNLHLKRIPRISFHSVLGPVQPVNHPRALEQDVIRFVRIRRATMRLNDYQL